MDFVLFVILNATLFIRPAELIPGLVGIPIYNALLLMTLVASALKIGPRLTLSSLKTDPITVCVLGFTASIFLSHLAHANFQLAREGLFVFSTTILLYYLVLVAVIDSPSRLRRFLASLVLFIVVLTTLALLHYHEFVNIPSLAAIADAETDASGEVIIVMRLCSTGIFNDPNDLGLILLVGTGACLFLAGGRPGGLPKPYWLTPILLFLYALTQTHSKGGFLSLLAGMMALFFSKYGIRKTAFLAPLVLPVMFVLFAGRQTSISTDDDSGQARIQLWGEGFVMLRQSPLFGAGYGLYGEIAPQVAHNSYVHAYGELGFLGGALFLGSFAYSIWTLLALGRRDDAIHDLELKKLRPFLLAILVSYTFGMLMLSRNYVIPTYLLIGLVSAYLRMVGASGPGLIANEGPIRPVSLGLIGRLTAFSLAFLVACNLFIKVFVRYDG